MRIVSFFKNNLFFQNFASWFVSMIPPMVEHNLQKYEAIKKSFYITALDQVEGDYLEFGVFTGSSFVFATRMHRKLRSLGALKTKFFGFDSFEGFGKKAEDDKHPFYLDDIFRVDAKKIIGNIRNKAGNSEVEIVKGYFEDSLRDKTPASFGISKCRIIFIDCDLKAPAQLALEFVRPVLQKGSILIMDDFFQYRGDLHLGVSGAFEAFKKKYPEVEWRRLLDYGYGGIAYIVSRIGD